MDPVSGAIGIYLNGVMSISNKITSQMDDDRNIYATAVVLEYDDSKIKFQHQLWKVKDQSVCNDQKHEISKYSSCTIKAKKLFGELCNSLSKEKPRNHKIDKYKNMYCNAAIAFNPTVAKIGPAKEKSKIDSLRSKCNQATAEAMGSNSPKAIKNRNTACEKYRESIE